MAAALARSSLAAQQRRMLYVPRPGQAKLHELLKRFSVVVCHRRWGKTVFAVNTLLGSALRAKRISEAGRPHFAYIGPLRNQTKTIAWDLLKHYARPFIRTSADINEAELRVDVLGNARIQLFGADNPDAARGVGLNGAVFDEYADMAPAMRTQVIGPALADRQGYQLFIGTPKGPNHFKTLYDEAVAGDPAHWMHATIKASESGVLSDDELAMQRSLMSPEEYAQEFECSFVAPVSGSYYGKLIEQLREKKRICDVPHEPGLSVYTAWDLGIGDATAIWCFQLVGREIRLLDYIENSGVGLDWYVTELRRRSYTYGTHILPHDAEVKELGTGRSRLETLRSLGIGQITIIAAQSVDDGIAAVRNVLPRCWFDAKGTVQGLKALEAYRAEYDHKRQTFNARPRHDWASHGADAMRYLALGLTRLGDKAPTALVQRASPINYPHLGTV